jgi:hypothetical protein
MPLHEGAVWTYAFEGVGGLKRTFEMRTARPAPVSSFSGWEIDSDFGVSKMAWSSESLLASELSGARFEPPIILLKPGLGDGDEVTWSGTMRVGGVDKEATAVLSQKSEKIEVENESYQTLRAELLISTKETDLSLLTWYAKGIGIVRQQQRSVEKGETTNAAPPLPEIELLSGP